MGVVSLYVIDIASSSILQYGCAVGSGGVSVSSYDDFSEAVQFHLEWEEGERLNDILQYLQ